MTDKSKALQPIIEKVGKVFARLSSLTSDNRDDAVACNDVLTSVVKMNDILKEAGLDVHDLWQIGFVDNKDRLKAILAMLLQKDVDVLLKIAQERATYFCNDAVFADVEVRGHPHTYAIESKAFKEWLLQQFFLETRRAPTGSSIKTAIHTQAAHVKFGPEMPRHIDVHLRTAEVDGRIYIDLCNEQFQCVEVDDNGWRVIDSPPQVRFRRTDGMRSLPVPQRGGNIDRLRKFVNLTDSDFILFVAVLLDAFRLGKHPILNLVGEHGTAKSTLAKIFKLLVDPDETELRSLPGTVRDIFIAVNSARVRAWDNVSKIERATSDALCQLSDGSGFGIRRLYTDDDEFRVQGSRSIILTGLTNCATRPDLGSRTVLLSLHPIKDAARKSETELWAGFNEARPFVFGALLDALAHGLQQLPTVKLDSASRMKDFELFAHACEGAYAPAGSFSAALAANATELNEALIEDDPVAKAITAFMVKRSEWSGTTTELMIELQTRDDTEQQVSKQKDWPKDATRFSRRVRVVSATLRKAGVEVFFGQLSDRNKTRNVTLRNIFFGRSDARTLRTLTRNCVRKARASRPRPAKRTGVRSVRASASRPVQRATEEEEVTE
jgi:hypothetical protein